MGLLFFFFSSPEVAIQKMTELPMRFAETGLCKLLTQSQSKLGLALTPSPGSRPLSPPTKSPIPPGLHFLIPIALSAFISLTFEAVVLAWDL